MHQVTAEALDQEGAEDIRDDYSGRNMYGKTTHAVVFEDWKDAIKAIVSVAFECGQNHSDDVRVSEKEIARLDTIIDDLQKVRYDSLGRNIVLY